MNEKLLSAEEVWDKEEAITAALKNKASCNTVYFFANIMHYDPHYSGVRFNKMMNSAEVHEKNDRGQLVVRRWTDTDEAESRAYIEKTYGIYNKDKHTDALRILFHSKEYDPIVDIVKAQKWDGVERCEEFLIKYAKAKDCPYTREASRLIFAEGIARLMLPGSKCDDVVILMGMQGCGKSSLIKFLALNDDYFGEVKTMDGDKNAVEQLSGKFILEIAELAALTRSKDVESVKAFVTRQRDVYRKPYDRNVTELPRRCIFLGSTNSYQFLSDKSGARRWYPVQCYSNGYEIHRQENEIREYVLQCWAEAYEKHLQGKMPHYANEELIDEYRKAQADAMEDDWRDGAIEKFLDSQPIGAFVYARQIYKKALCDVDSQKEPTLKESKDIGAIVNKNPNWERARQMTEDGQQRGWRKIGSAPPPTETVVAEVAPIEEIPTWIDEAMEAEGIELPKQEEIKETEIEEREVVADREDEDKEPWMPF